MKRTLILLSITLLLAAWVYWFEVREESRTASTDEQQQLERTVTGVSKADLKAFTIKAADGPAITIERSGEGWVMTAPLGDDTEEADRY